MTFWDLQMAQGVTKSAIATGFMTTAEYGARPQAASGQAFVDQLYAGFLGRAPDASGKGFWTSAPNQTLSRGALAALFDDSAESKTANAFATSKILARNDAETLVHDLYETVLGREAELTGLGFWVNDLTIHTQAQVTQLIAGQTEGPGAPCRPNRRAIRCRPVPERLRPRAHQRRTEQHLGAASIRPDPVPACCCRSPATRRPKRIGLATTWASRPRSAASPTSRRKRASRSVNSFPQQTRTAPASSTALVSGPAGASVDPSTGLFAAPAATAPQTSTVTVAATDPTGLAARSSFSIAVLATPPVLTATGPGSAIEGADTYVTLSSQAAAPGAVVTGWSVNWG